MFKTTFLACILVLVVLSTEASKSKLPSNVPQRLYCFGCIATVKEMQKTLSKRRVTKANRESKVMALMDEICSPDNFVEYEYSPPKTVNACKLLLENHEEEVETAFVKDRADKQNYICNEVSQACDGIDTAKKQTPSENADIDLSDGVEGDTISQTVKIDPETGKVEQERRAKKDGKTMSKKAKKTKTKKKSKKEKKEKTGKSNEKGNLHQMNVDINDPASMERIMKQIKDITDQDKNKKKKVEL